MNTLQAIEIEQYELQRALSQATVSLESLVHLEQYSLMVSNPVLDSYTEVVTGGMESIVDGIINAGRFFSAIQRLIDNGIEIIERFIKWITDYFKSDVRRVKRVIAAADRVKDVSVDTTKAVKLSQSFIFLKASNLTSPISMNTVADLVQVNDDSARRFSNTLNGLIEEMAVLTKTIHSGGSVRNIADVETLLSQLRVSWRWTQSLVNEYSTLKTTITNDGNSSTRHIAYGHVGNGKTLVIHITTFAKNGKIRLSHTLKLLDKKDLVAVSKLKALTPLGIKEQAQVFIRHNDNSNRYAKVLKQSKKELSKLNSAVSRLGKTISTSDELVGDRVDELTTVLASILNIVNSANSLGQAVFSNAAKGTGLLTNALEDLVKHIESLDV